MHTICTQPHDLGTQPHDLGTQHLSKNIAKDKKPSRFTSKCRFQREPPGSSGGVSVSLIWSLVLAQALRFARQPLRGSLRSALSKLAYLRGTVLTDGEQKLKNELFKSKIKRFSEKRVPDTGLLTGGSGKWFFELLRIQSEFYPCLD